MELSVIIALLEQYRYALLFPLACVEGPILGFIAGSLVPLGYFSALPLLAVLVAADVIPDLIYWSIGRWGKRKGLVERAGHKIGLTPERFGVIERLWHNHPIKAMALTKFAYGLSTPLLLTAGLVHLPVRKFFILSTALALLQYSVLVALGMLFGSSFAAVKSGLVRVQLIVAAAVIVFIVYYFFTGYVRKTFLAQKDAMASE